MAAVARQATLCLMFFWWKSVVLKDWERSAASKHCSKVSACELVEIAVFRNVRRLFSRFPAQKHTINLRSFCVVFFEKTLDKSEFASQLRWGSGQEVGVFLDPTPSSTGSGNLLEKFVFLCGFQNIDNAPDRTVSRCRLVNWLVSDAKTVPDRAVLNPHTSQLKGMLLWALGSQWGT